MILVTMEEIIQSIPTLEKISQESFSGVIAFQIGRLIRELEKELQEFESARKKMLEKYAIRDENGQIKIENENILIKPEYIEKYNEEITELLKTKIEINSNVLSLSCLNSISLTPQQALSLNKFFE